MKQRILIIGTGFAGLWSALSAARLLDLHGDQTTDITVLAPQAELRLRPRFYEADAEQMRVPLTDLFTAVGIQFIAGIATRIDTADQRVEYRDASAATRLLNYDRLVLATGSKMARPALQGGFDIDQLESAARLQHHLQTLDQQPASAARNTVVIAGGGFTGIEIASEMPARLRAVLGEDAAIRVVVVDKGHQIGGALGEGPRHVIAEATAELGIEWQLQSTVIAVDAGGVTLADGRRIDASTVIRTTGVRASALAAHIPAPRDAWGRLHVDSNLCVTGQTTVFASGDVACAATDTQGNYALMSCQHAIALGRSAGNNAAASLLGLEPIAYSQPTYVTCLDLGAWGAVFTEGWERQVKLVRAEAKQLKSQINRVWIYPPAANRAEALAAADPLIPVVA